MVEYLRAGDVADLNHWTGNLHLDASRSAEYCMHAYMGEDSSKSCVREKCKVLRQRGCTALRVQGVVFVSGGFSSHCTGLACPRLSARRVLLAMQKRDRRERLSALESSHSTILMDNALCPAAMD